MKVFVYCFAIGIKIILAYEKVCNTTGERYVTSANIHKFYGCTKIEGDLKIFDHELRFRHLVFQPNQLNALRAVREVTGVVFVYRLQPAIKTLFFLSNLISINGENVERNHGFSLFVHLTALESLNLTSLRQIKNGNVAFIYNIKLCYINSKSFEAVFRSSSQRVILSFNRPEQECERLGKVCSSECTTYGCWGPGKENCIKIRNNLTSFPTTENE